MPCGFAPKSGPISVYGGRRVVRSQNHVGPLAFAYRDPSGVGRCFDVVCTVLTRRCPFSPYPEQNSFRLPWKYVLE